MNDKPTPTGEETLLQRLRVDYVCDEHTWAELDSFHVRNEAADEIERLRGVVTTLRSAVADMECYCLPFAEPGDGMCQRCEAMRA